MRNSQCVIIVKCSSDHNCVSGVRTFSAPGVGRETSDSFSVAGGGVALL